MGLTDKIIKEASLREVFDSTDIFDYTGGVKGLYEILVPGHDVQLHFGEYREGGHKGYEISFSVDGSYSPPKKGQNVISTRNYIKLLRTIGHIALKIANHNKPDEFRFSAYNEKNSNRSQRDAIYNRVAEALGGEYIVYNHSLGKDIRLTHLIRSDSPLLAKKDEIKDKIFQMVDGYQWKYEVYSIPNEMAAEFLIAHIDMVDVLLTDKMAKFKEAIWAAYEKHGDSPEDQDVRDSLGMEEVMYEIALSILYNSNFKPRPGISLTKQEEYFFQTQNVPKVCRRYLSSIGWNGTPWGDVFEDYVKDYWEKQTA